MLWGVIGAVERFGRGIFVGGSGFGIGVGWQEVGKLEDAGLEFAVAGAFGVADECARGDAAGAFLAIANGDAEDLIAVDADGASTWRSASNHAFGHDNFEGDGTVGGEIVWAKLAAVLALAEAQAHGGLVADRGTKRHARSGGLRVRSASRLAAAGCAPSGRRPAVWRVVRRQPGYPAPGRGLRECRRGEPDGGISPQNHGLARPLGFSEATLRKNLAGPVWVERHARRRRLLDQAVEIEVVGGFGFEGGVVEDERALIAGAARGDIAAAEQPTGPGGEEFLKLFAAGRAAAHGGGIGSSGAGSLRQRATISEEG